mgnify:CR=1 FL=1
MSISYLGIDPGIAGRMCLLVAGSDGPPLISSIPRKTGRLARRAIHLVKDNKAKDYNFVRMVELVEYCKQTCGTSLVVVIEEPPYFMRSGRQSNAKSIVDLHRGLGLWSAACQQCGLTLYQLSPATWKSKVKLLKTAKEYSLVRAAELSGYHLETTDAADAYLLAYVGRQLKLEPS